MLAEFFDRSGAFMLTECFARSGAFMLAENFDRSGTEGFMLAESLCWQSTLPDRGPLC